MKFGLTLPYGRPHEPGASDPGFATQVIRKAEALGFESVWAGEHVIMARDYQPLYPYAPDGQAPVELDTAFPEPLTWLAWAAAHTSTLKLGTAVVVLPQRQPVLLAKQAATLDAMSGGRLILGVGVGWQKEEMEALGYTYEDRGHRADEFIRAMQELWCSDESSFTGASVAFQKAHCYPKPSRPGGVPLLIGGHSCAAARRAGRLAHGMFALVDDPESAARLRKEMTDAARGAGRGAEELELSVGRPPIPVEAITPALLDEMKAFRDAGVDRLVLFRLFDRDPLELNATLESFRAKVMDRL